MAVVPRSLLTFGARLLSARAAARLRRKAATAQQQVLAGLIPKLAKATEWRESGLEPGMNYDLFRERVRPRTYDDMAPQILRMQQGIPDVLWPGTCQIYARTAGTSTGNPKLIPVTEAMLAHFKRTGLDAVLWYCARARRASVFRGRHLHLGGSTALSPIPESEGFESYSGDLSAIAALNLPAWVERAFLEPGAEIAGIADWTERLAAITERSSAADVTLLAGMPGWTLVLAESLRAHSAEGGEAKENLQQIWPHFECYIHGGVPADPFLQELRSVLGPTVNFHEVYMAAEGFIAAQDADPSLGLRLMADAGVFYEFLPMSVFDTGRLSSMGAKALPIWEIQPGVDYALLLTTPAGLARYVIGDVVRFISTEPPRFVYVGRTELRLNAIGENVVEKEITDALLAICRRNGWTTVNFHVAPLASRSALGPERSRHEWWVELHPGTAITPTGPIMAVELDTELKLLSAGYRAKRNDGTLGAPYVRLVMPGVFEHWMRFRGKWGGQNKMPRCRNDRVIADELGGALQFAKD